MKDDGTEKLKRLLRRRTGDAPKALLSSGCTLLNLACSGSAKGAFQKGKFFYLVGDSMSGKTWVCLNTLAEASISPHFKDYRLIFNNAEDGALMDIQRYFGKAMKERMEVVSSSTLEEFYYHLDDVNKEGTPYVYVLDSMDALTPEDDLEKFDKNKKAWQTGKEESGSYGMAKAKMNSSGIRNARVGVKKTDSILLVISQTRDKVGGMPSFGPQKTRSGGKSLRFYATNELWFSVKGEISKTVRGNKVKVGDVLKVKVEKNRQSGSEIDVDLVFHKGHGIDDITTSINFLTHWKHWKENSGKVVAGEFDFSGKLEALVRKIEEEELEKDLRVIVSRVWEEIQSQAQVKRRRRYE